MPPTPPDAASQATLSLAQQREALWADARQRVYAALVGARIAGLGERLAVADVDDWDLLWTGELDPAERDAAPVLVTLRRASAFTDWLLADAAREFGAWGALVLSPASFLVVRERGRALCRAQLPNGQSTRVDWMDPEVMEVLLSAASPDQLQRAFASIDAFVSLAPDRWTRWSAPLGRLQRQTTGVLS